MDARDLLTSGVAHSKQGNFSAAIDDFTQALTLPSPNTTRAKIYFSRAFAFNEQKNFVEAINDYTQSIALHTENYYKADAHLGRGVVYQDQGNFDAAINECTLSIALCTKDDSKVKPYMCCGYAYTAKGNIAKAIDSFIQVILLRTTDDHKASAHFELGVVYASQDDFTKAVNHYTLALAFYSPNNPQAAQAYHNRGRSYYFLKNFAETIKDCTQAIALFPNNDDKAKVYNMRFLAYKEQRSFAKAIDDCTQAISLYSTDGKKAIMYAGRGFIYSKFKKRNFIAEINDYTQALILDPAIVNKDYILVRLNDAYEDQENFAKAQIEADKLIHDIRLNPNIAEEINKDTMKALCIVFTTHYQQIKNLLSPPMRMAACHEGEPPQRMLDVVHSELMNKPLILSCGHTLDEKTLLQLLKKECPSCRAAINDTYFHNPIVNLYAQNDRDDYIQEQEALAEQPYYPEVTVANNLEEKPPQRMIDRYGHGTLMSNPVIVLCCRNTIDKKTLLESKDKKCPCCEEPVENRYLQNPIVNFYAKDDIDEYIELKKLAEKQRLAHTIVANSGNPEEKEGQPSLKIDENLRTKEQSFPLAAIPNNNNSEEKKGQPSAFLIRRNSRDALFGQGGNLGSSNQPKSSNCERLTNITQQKLAPRR